MLTPRILVVDAHHVRREVVAMLLEHDGMDTRVTSSLAEARQLLATQRFEAVIARQGNEGDALTHEVESLPAVLRPHLVWMSEGDGRRGTVDAARLRSTLDQLGVGHHHNAHRAWEQTG